MIMQFPKYGICPTRGEEGETYCYALTDNDSRANVTRMKYYFHIALMILAYNKTRPPLLYIKFRPIARCCGSLF